MCIQVEQIEYSHGFFRSVTIMVFPCCPILASAQARERILRPDDIPGVTSEVCPLCDVVVVHPLRKISACESIKAWRKYGRNGQKRLSRRGLFCIMLQYTSSLEVQSEVWLQTVQVRLEARSLGHWARQVPQSHGDCGAVACRLQLHFYPTGPDNDMTT